MNMLQAFDVREVWDSIYPGIIETKVKTNPEWRPEDLYAACVNGQSHIFKPDADSPDFVLLAQSVSTYTGKRLLKIVIAYSKDGDAVEKYGAEIDAIGREAGCAESEFSSPRKGWERHGPKHGYEPVMTVYRRKLN